MEWRMSVRFCPRTVFAVDLSPYADRMSDLDAWKSLLQPEQRELMALAADADPTDVRVLTALRKLASMPMVTVALELAAARRKAVAKFAAPETIVADAEGVEQATGERVAAHKARRFAEAGIAQVVDLCCGIGGDARALAGVAEVLAVDRSPLRAWMCERNAGCATEVADIETRPWPETAFHLDPSRREESGRRKLKYADVVPGPPWIERLLAAQPDGAVKLGPGIDADELPPGIELEFVTDRGRLVEAILWSGRLARHPNERTATRLPDGATVSGAPSIAHVAEEDYEPAHLYVADPALERAGLVGGRADDGGLFDLAPGLGILGGDARVADPFLTGFEVIEMLPFREKAVGAAIRARGFGRVEVKTRGRAVEPNVLEKRWRGDGAEVGTVFVLRLGKRLVAWITRRHS